MNTVYDNLVKGKKAQWFCSAKVIHSVSYTPDLAKGTAILGNTDSAYNKVWNLPTDSQKITGEEWINLKEFNYTPISNAMAVEQTVEVLAIKKDNG